MSKHVILELEFDRNNYFFLILSLIMFIEVEHGYASSLPGPFILDPESYTQTRDLTKQVTSSVNGAPSNNRRLKSINRKPQGNR